MAKDKLYFENGRIAACTEYAAKYFGVTAQTLSNWGKDGCPKLAYGMWDIKAVTDYIQTKEGGKLAEELETNPEKMSLQAQKTFVETQLKAAQLETSNFKNAINRGDYLERKFVVGSLSEFFIVLRRSLVGLGKKLGKEVAPYVGQDEARKLAKLIDDDIADALSQMSVEGVYSAKG